MADFFQSPLASVPLESLLKFTPLAPRLQQHVAKVYVTLAMALGCCGLGATVLVLPSFLALLGALGCSIALALTPATPQNLKKRYGFVAGFAISQGSLIAPLLELANIVDPSIVITGILCTAAIFACFTISALSTPRRTYMFLGGYLASATLGLFLISLSRSFFPSSAAFGLELYLGLLVFAGYVLFDTQVIVEKAAGGDSDHLKHAVLLLTDVINLFVRIVIILMRNQQKREDDKKKQRK
uniref:Bax inhibitor 1 n=1 Tax=Dunaliella tertiolecta TaxID=3047 RepID=A0A7S3VH78_DUNTE|mmetsp:Transcript_18555/g.52130  ORF Transcript_18555/g.52130 Transcript_18555/m.52130 type:complete len:241 (+) Transcript_18555:709-1431(+)|eukprot:CAMPEP_0202358224 /NCGR_PEP_ID=MMETSP1126-20121109/11965_1 /ASSEMBLY_ACC=CAM_ASM_000457 /TAXON_ID=3047 /ORGANISM="Dunaliella tertiolecta, Strain CCMP1320" /LENGTH=240 /DNA_ID=CAMNT_0048951319 /DNA_START=59 /DNA_END=781 /DNA_ORIENTATION=+